MRRLPQPDPDDVEIETIYCFGCGRKLGVAAEEKMAVYCEELCWYKEQVIAIDAATRNRAFGFLIERMGLTVTAVALAFGKTRARVNQVLAESNDSYLATGRREPISARERADRSRAGKIGRSARRSSPQK